MKRIIAALTSAVLLMSSAGICASAATMYAADGRLISVADWDVEAYKNAGWYTEPVMTVYALDGRTLVIPIKDLAAFESVGWYRELPGTTLYAADGRTASVAPSDVSAWLAVGWYTEPVTTVYALDGRTLVIPVAQVSAYESVGWYKELPKTTLYAADGRTASVLKSDVDAWLAVGWFTEPQVTELTAEQIYANCSPAVFFIEVYNTAGYAIGTGSGFFIDDKGTAVTNFHVIDKAASAKIQLSDSGAVYDVPGVYDYDKTNDWAVIKVNCSGNSYLSFGDGATIVGGASIYTIGSPEGFQNTISQGLISNPGRVIDGVTYIQITAPISHGSSGGALINKYGKVIGITSASYSEGQNLNLAIPISVIYGCDASTVTPIAAVNGYISQKPAHGVKYYAEFASIPDFGACTGARLYDKSSTDTAFYYEYRILSFHPDMLFLYWDILESCGFESTGGFEDDKYGNKYLCFENSTTGYCVTMGIFGDAESYLVMITRS